jgi:hypothetical protein
MSKKKITYENFMSNVLRRWKKSMNKASDERIKDIMTNGTPKARKKVASILKDLESLEKFDF